VASSTCAPSADGRRSDDPQPRRHLIFAIVAVALAMASLDATIVSTALKPIQEELHAPITWGAWTITAYNLAQVVVMPLAGKISDLYGPKRVFLGAAAIFAVSSLLCGMAQNIYVLVGLRALQAIGGGAFMPSASGIVADQYGRNKARALGLFTSIFSIGGVTGPVVGGFIVTYWSWRGVFFVNIPFSIVMIALAAVFLPSGTRRRGTRLDIWGAATLACFLLGALFSITELGDGASALSARFLVPLVCALVAVTLFIRHSRRAEAPFVPARLLVGHGFGTMNLVNFVFGAFAIGTSALLPLYAQDHYGIPPLESGTLLTIRALGMICVTGLAVMAMHRTGYRRPILLGITVVSIGLFLVSLSPVGHVSPYLWLGVSAGITGLGMGVAMPAANNATLHLAPTQVAAVSGLRGMFRQAGGLTAISIATAVAAQTANPGHALGIAFLSIAVAALCILPLAMRIPDEPTFKAKDAARSATPGSRNSGDTDDSSQPATSAAA
jgi:EmrB/QacA subfamily drug resistance transporter